MKNRFYPVIGMSPGNSYFKDEEIRYLLNEVIKRYGKTAILVADVPAIATYTAFGYPENKARNKAIPKGNNLKNRTKRIANELGFDDETVRIIDWNNEVEINSAYQAFYKTVKNLYINNVNFTNAVDATTQAVLEGSSREIEDLTAATKVAVHYLLSELAFLEFAPQFFGFSKIIYVYHQNWPVYEDYVAGKFDNEPKQHLDFLLLENPYETFNLLEEFPGDKVATNLHESAYQRIMRTKVIRASFEDYLPAFVKDKVTGEYSGIFYEVLKRIADEHNLIIQFTEETGYGVIIEGLDRGRFDIFASTVWPTLDRINAADFSLPLYYSDVYLWIREDQANITYDQTQDDEFFRLAVKERDVSFSIACEYFPDNRRVYVPQLADPLVLLDFVAAGKADGTFAEPFLVEQFNKYSTIRLVKVEDNPIIRYGNTFMMRAGESEFKKLLDNSINEYLKNGFVTTLIEKYAGNPSAFQLP